MNLASGVTSSAGPSVAASRDWGLFTDWCLAMESPVTLATPDLVAAFLMAVPGKPSSDKRRRRSIQAGLRDAGLDGMFPATPPASLIRTGECYGSISEALAALPAARYPAGLRSRRDGWLLVLLGTLQLTRSEALTVQADNVQLFPAVTVLGRLVPRTEVAGECPACAVHRWLRVLGPAARGWTAEVHVTLNDAFGAPDRHDCETGLDGSWRSAPTLAAGISRHGHLNRDEPLSPRAVSAIVTARLRLGALPPAAGATRVHSGRFDSLTLNELASAYDDVDRQAADLNARLAEILGSGADLLDRVNEISPAEDSGGADEVTER